MAKGKKQHFISGKKVKNRHFNWLIKKILTNTNYIGKVRYMVNNNTSGKVLEVDFRRRRRRRPSGRRGQEPGGGRLKKLTVPGDFMLFAFVVAIVLFGMVMVFSSSYYNASLDESLGNNPFYYLMN